MEVIKPKRKDVEFKENRENGQQKKQVYKSRAAIEEARRKLPIYESRQKIVDTIRNNPVTVIIGETGSGKTTQVPQFLYEAGFLNDKKRKEGKGGEANGGMMIGITQPRRVAATSVARRVSEEMGVKMGREVGYSIRFEDFTSKETKIKYLTDGMLIREAMLDNALSRYKVIIIDEAHERSLRTDILLGVLKQKIEASGSGNNQDFRVYVVDCGVNKVKKYNHVLKYETLQVEPITRTSARQRAGRAGRTSDGECYRLYPESYFVNEMEEDNLAEIKVLNLTRVQVYKGGHRVGIDIVYRDWRRSEKRPLVIDKGVEYKHTQQQQQEKHQDDQKDHYANLQNLRKTLDSTHDIV
ncbi:putative pre-mRNA-splicing factor ATP-dependent RNA helicase DHX16 [Zancudomyces culisetae]|uniref:RNA helicase n=1 Tax=Zancudomyces culisetae TaxID=1213189 RepID=A0A1R1PMZ3_ZANCU|nr:putative pre-mRNA-splicing factor ATP-dependent RNA helicase DHX16 [Zancudomyces culisetae]|eukprot:OMH82301.1 putative pre-mRNA-splicing factor ATP-dependent RNA helicase DHX16 [Zancudomyces culisetae]